MPALERGLGAGRQAAGATSSSRDRCSWSPAPTRRSTRRRARGTKQQIAFYGSTPAYRGVLELHGWGDLQSDLNRLSKQGEWEQMGELVDDEILDTFAVTGEPEEIPRSCARPLRRRRRPPQLLRPVQDRPRALGARRRGVQERGLTGRTYVRIVVVLPRSVSDPRGGSVFAQVLGELEQISRELIPRAFDGRVPWSSSTTRHGRSGCARRSRPGWRAGSRRRGSGARAGIAVRRTGWRRRPARRSVPRAGRWRRRGRSNSCPRPTPRSGPASCPDVRRRRSRARPCADPARRGGASRSGRLDEREGTARPMPAGARRRRGRRPGVGTAAARRAARARVDRSRRRVPHRGPAGAGCRRAVQLGVEGAHRSDLLRRAPSRATRAPRRLRGRRARRAGNGGSVQAGRGAGDGRQRGAGARAHGAG